MLSLLLALFFQHLVIDGFFAFEDLKTHIGSAKVAADTDEVCFLRTAAIDDGVFVGLTMQVMLMASPVSEVVVSPPTMSMSHLSQARRRPW